MTTPSLTLDRVPEMLNLLYRVSGAAYFFDKPLLGIASAADPWFERFKTLIGEHHWTPQQALNFSDSTAQAKSVIVWILPVREEVRASNRVQTSEPGVEWAAMRSFGEQTNDSMRKQMARLLQENGYAAIPPHTEQIRQGLDVYGMGFTSHWSERHAAFVAGLGTFGLSASLITERGVAHRVGTVVTSLELPPSPRSYGDDPFAWCTHCGACIRRCPAHAIGPRIEDRDKRKCCDHIVKEISAGRDSKYGWMDLGLGCGLCQTKVPCEHQRPDLSGK